MQERDITKAFDGITPDKELKEKVLEAIENHKPRKFNWDFSRIVPVALCAVVLVNGFILFKSLPERNNSVIPLDLSSTNISNNMVVDITTTSIPVTEITGRTDGFTEFECDYTKGDIVMEMPPDFLDEDAKELFNEASYIWEKAKLYFYLVEIPDIPDPIWEDGFLDSGQVVQIDSGGYATYYIKSGVSYQSFYDYLTSIFTESYTNEDFPLENNINVNGELCVYGFKDPIGHIQSGREYELISQTDSRIEFKCVNYYRADDVIEPGVSKEEYKAKYPNEPFEWTSEANFVMIKTENGWRFDEFSVWSLTGEWEEVNQDLPLETTTEPSFDRSAFIDDQNCIVQDEWIYFNYGYILYRVRTDGTELTTISSDRDRFKKPYSNNVGADGIRGDESVRMFQVVGDWIYYNTVFYDKALEFSLYKVRTDGTEKTFIALVGSTDFMVDGEWIYYMIDDCIYRVRIDGTENTKVISGDVYLQDVNNGWVYYGEYQGNKTYKIRVGGTEKTEVINFFVDKMVINDGWIYYTKYNGLINTDEHFKVREGGAEHIKINSEDDLGEGIIMLNGIIKYSPDNKMHFSGPFNAESLN